MPILFIPVAIPGSGKTWWVRGLPDEITHHSSDAARRVLGKDPASVDQEVFDTYHEWIKTSLQAGYSVYADATNLRHFARERLCSIAAEHGAKTHLILFRNTTQAIARNSQRNGTTPGTMAVPPDAMFKLIEQYERALVDIANEHYDFITEVSRVG